MTVVRGLTESHDLALYKKKRDVPITVDLFSYEDFFVDAISMERFTTHRVKLCYSHQIKENVFSPTHFHRKVRVQRAYPNYS